MNRNTKILFISLGFIILISFLVLEFDNKNYTNTSLSNSEDTPTEDTPVDRKSPDFTLTDLEGNNVSLSDHKGNIVFLNFWATWCGFCDEEMPYLQNISDNNSDLTVLAVNVGEPEAAVKKYIDKGGYTFPILLDLDSSVAAEYLVGGLPTTYLIDKEGNLLSQISGMMSEEQMEEVLEAIRDLE